MFAHNALLMGGGGVPNSILSTQTFTDTSIPASFNYPANYSAGTKLVFAFASNTADGVFSMSDSEANSFSKVVEESQSNGATVSAIFSVTLTGDVTTSDTFTIATTGNDSRPIGGVVYELQSSTVKNSTSSQPDLTTNPSQSITGISPGNVVIHVLSTASTNSNTATASFDIDLQDDPSASNYFIFSTVADAGSVTNTVTTDQGTKYASVMAAFS